MRGWWTWCSAWRTFQKNPVKQNLKGSTSRKAVCRPFPHGISLSVFFETYISETKMAMDMFPFSDWEIQIFIHGSFSSHVSYWSVYPMVFLYFENSGYIWSINGGCRISDVLGPKIPASSDCDGRDDSHVRTWGRWINGDVWRWAFPQLMAPCSAWVLKIQTTPFWVEEFFGKEHFVGSCGLAVIIHICFWFLSFCRDWNFARVQNIIFTKNNCSKVRRAHSFSANYPDPWNDLTASWSSWKFQQLVQMKFPKMGQKGLFAGVLKGYPPWN